VSPYPLRSCVTGDEWCPLGVPERVFQRGTLRSEQFCSVFHDVHVVLQTDAEISADVNARLIAEGHLRLKFRRVAADEIGPLVAVHAYAVSQAMREVFVIRAVARVGDDLARGCRKRRRETMKTPRMKGPLCRVTGGWRACLGRPDGVPPPYFVKYWF